MSRSIFNWQTAQPLDLTQRYQLATPAGIITIKVQGTLLCKMQWLDNIGQNALALPIALHTQIYHGWLKRSPEIPLPLLHQGTDFQHKVWCALRHIPLGQTQSYGELARQLNTSPRALANACRQNPFPLLIPCHRALAKTGIGGYAGQVTGPLIEIKKTLLEYEKRLANEL